MGTLFFAAALVMYFVLSKDLCELTSHYIDGIFFGNVCILLAVMMVYKYWDSITKEDLEFSVGGKTQVWEVQH
jgi:phosphosulfolactate synthase (CoM biosynthesis protein A)